MILNLIALFLSFLHFNIFGLNYNEWDLRKNQDSIKVYIRDIDNNTKEYLAETTINSEIDKIFNTIIDFDNSYKWMYKLNSSEILEKTDTLMYVYFVVDMNWPLKNRDLVSDAVITKKNDEIIIEMNSYPDHIPINEKLIRIKESRSIWILKSIDKERTKVSLQSYAVVEGIPTFIMDLFILDSPMYSISQLRKKF